MHYEQAGRRWIRRPEGSTWGDYGVDDTLGRLNLVTGDKVLEGIREVVTGRTFSLSLPLNLPGGNALNPNRYPPIHRPNLREGVANAACRMDDFVEGALDVLSDDLWILHSQYSTQWDALAHAGSLFDADDDGESEPVLYNGFRVDGHGASIPEHPEDCSSQSPDRLKSTVDYGPLGVHNLATCGIQGRAVLIDIEKYYGVAPRRIGYKELEYVLAADSLDIRRGDILLIHTGYAQMLLEEGGDPPRDLLHNYGAGLDGRDPELLEWITESQVAAIAADNSAVEVYPSSQTEPPFSLLPLHEHCIFRLGLPLGELWYLSELAWALRAICRSSFLLTAPALHLPGSAGSPLNPIATL